MKKKTKTEDRFENGKNLKKEEDICFCWELNSRRFVMAEVGNYLKNRFSEKKGYLLSLRVELKTFRNGRDG